MALSSINPATGEKLRDFAEHPESEIQFRIERSRKAFESHRGTSIAERARKMTRVAEILEIEVETWARVMTLEMGKPIQSAREEAAKCARCCRYYAENAASFLADRPVPTDADRSFVRFLPLGPILAIMPWNFPFWQVFRFAAPTLMAGNTGLLKHASNVPQCALAIEEIFGRAGFEAGVFQTLLVRSQDTRKIIENPGVQGVSLTGSENAGIDVGRTAGSGLKKVVLELGGSDPFVVMPSANIEKAVRTAVTARTLNNGQSCIAAKRFILAEPIADHFEELFTRAMSKLKIGDPLEESVQIGPLATPSILEDVERQVRETVQAGAQVLCGGARLSRRGNFFPPTVITRIPKGSPGYQEEVFGPVALLFRVRDLDEAIRLANDTRFGLGSALWSEDAGEQDRFINDIEAGLTFINGMVASDPRLPFGGVKSSGHGRELGDFGIREFVNVKTVWIRAGSGGPARQAGTE